MIRGLDLSCLWPLGQHKNSLWMDKTMGMGMAWGVIISHFRDKADASERAGYGFTAAAAAAAASSSEEISIQLTSSRDYELRLVVRAASG